MTHHTTPTDNARTARPRVGMVMSDARVLPGVTLLGLAVVGLVGSLVVAVMGSFGWAASLIVVAAIVAVAGIVWFSVDATRLPAGRHRAIKRR